jgi:hypothetical protein
VHRGSDPDAGDLLGAVMRRCSTSSSIRPNSFTSIAPETLNRSVIVEFMSAPQNPKTPKPRS